MEAGKKTAIPQTALPEAKGVLARTRKRVLSAGDRDRAGCARGCASRSQRCVQERWHV